jgi:hypothetical protein
MSKENHGSITPRTVRHKQFFPITEELKGEISEYDRAFEDQYLPRNQQYAKILDRQAQNSKLLAQLDKYSNSERLKTVAVKFDKKAEIVEKAPEIIGTIGPEQIVRPLSHVTIFQHRKEDGLTQNLSFDLTKPIVRHYGIDASNASIFIGHVIDGIRLHPLESIVFGEALKYLEKQIDTESFLRARDLQVTTTEEKAEELEERLAIPKPNNAVLVSFFPRKGSAFDEFLNSNKTICADEKRTDEVETHTIVLWKTGLKKITIIDPSDSKFSEFFKEVLKSTYGEFDFEISALTTKMEGRIYQPNKHVGDIPEDFERDCTDIAAKIAFELNEKQITTKCTSVKMVLDGASEQISNYKLPNEIGLLKPLQSSDVETRIAAKELVAVAQTRTDDFIDKAASSKKSKLSKNEQKELAECSFLKSLDVTKIITFGDVQEVSGLLGVLDLDDVIM